MTVLELIEQAWICLGGPIFGIDPTLKLGTINIQVTLTNKQLKELSKDIMNKRSYTENVDDRKEIKFRELTTYPFHFDITEGEYFRIREKPLYIK